jgi:hypothetical protein
MPRDGSPVRYHTIVMDSLRWDGFEFREDDIVISTPPKCGTTWMQMICALLVFQSPDLPRPLDELSPWLDMLTRSRDEVVAELNGQTHRRFIKTHTPLDGLPWSDAVTYVFVARDPRDAGFSWDNHLLNLDMGKFIMARQAAVGLDDLAELMPDGPPVPPADDELERFRLWVDSDAPPQSAVGSLGALVHHASTFWDARDRPNVVILRYEDLLADLEGSMRALADRLDIDVPEERWPALVQAATFDHMRARADEVVPDSTHSIWQSNAQFFHKGTSGQWQGRLDTQDVARYEAKMAALCPDDMAAWLHGRV